MSTQRVQDALDHSRAEGPAYCLLLVMAQVTKEGLVWMPPERLAAVARMSLRSMYEARAKLLELGEIEHAEKGGGRGKRSVYQLADLPALYSATHRRVSEPPAGAVVDGPYPARSRRDSSPETLRDTVGNSASLVRACEADQSGSTTPLEPPQGGADNGRVDPDRERQQRTAVAGADADPPPAGERWEAVLEECRERMGDDAGHVNMHLLPLIADEREDGTIVLAGRNVRWAKDRFGRVVDAAAERLGVVVEFDRPPPPQRAEPRRRRRRPVKRAA